ncbi:YccS/YhfK family integral membrane protein [Klebsiella pneumoniae]|nr:YccS/YhfK family integral membrane protein [Klebsiella pneumoniae]
MESPESEAPIGPLSTMEQHLQRILGHLNTMHTISSVAWRQRPHHGIWLRKINR